MDEAVLISEWQTSVTLSGDVLGLGDWRDSPQARHIAGEQWRVLGKEKWVKDYSELISHAQIQGKYGESAERRRIKSGASEVKQPNPNVVISMLLLYWPLTAAGAVQNWTGTTLATNRSCVVILVEYTMSIQSTFQVSRNCLIQNSFLVDCFFNTWII